MGGKSRKSGGVSKSLIDRIKSGKTKKDSRDTSKQVPKKSCTKQPTKPGKGGLF